MMLMRDWETAMHAQIHRKILDIFVVYKRILDRNVHKWTILGIYIWHLFAIYGPIIVDIEVIYLPFICIYLPKYSHLLHKISHLFPPYKGFGNIFEQFLPIFASWFALILSALKSCCGCEWVQLIIPDEQPCFDLTQISTLIEQLCWDCLNVYLCFLLDGRYV